MRNEKPKKCSVCGGVGHNRRTCGVAKVASQYVHKTPVLREFNREPLTLRNIISRWDAYTSRNTEGENGISGRASSGTVESVQGLSESCGGGYSEEDLETLWMLHNGKDGKLGKGKNVWGKNAIWERSDTEKLVNFVHDVESSQPDTSTVAWYKFFKGLGSEAKAAFVGAHTKVLTVRDHQMPSAYSPNEEILEKQLRADNEKKHKLPTKLSPIFVKDSSAKVRAVLAGSENVPVEILTLLAEDKNQDVVASVARRKKVSPEVLEKIYRRFTADDSVSSFRATKRKGGVWLVEKARWSAIAGIAGNQSTPQALLIEIANSDNAGESSVAQQLYRNPNLPSSVVEDKYSNAQRKLRTLKAERGNHRVAMKRLQKSIINYEGGDEAQILYAEALQRSQILANDIRKGEEAIYYFLQSGRVPRDETFNLVRADLRRGVKKSNHFVFETLKLTPFTSEQIDDLYENLKGEDSLYQLLGLVRNEKASRGFLKKVLRDIEKSNSDLTWSGLGFEKFQVYTAVKNLLN